MKIAADNSMESLEVEPMAGSRKKADAALTSLGHVDGSKPPAIAPSLRHFVSIFDLQADVARDLVDRTLRLKRAGAEDHRTSLLIGRTLGLVFEKPSLRTRVSFEAAMARLGGSSIFLRGKDVGLGIRESVADFGRVISQYLDVLAVRTFSQTV
ncbi:MAG TPA: hypothetical protein VJY33_05440, partial [Isosphaeraceae bacterium]|nr:hypothetical protein [Isosphaeraceae bacterium]